MVVLTTSTKCQNVCNILYVIEITDSLIPNLSERLLKHALKISIHYFCHIFGYGDIPLDTNTCANYVFPSFNSHKRGRIFKLIRKRYFKTHFESSLS